MKKLMELVDNLKKSLDKEDVIIDIKRLNKELSKNKELLEKINKYNKTLDENIKKEILEDKFFNKYKEKETELNILIMHINHELKKLTKNNMECNKHENN